MHRNVMRLNQVASRHLPSALNGGKSERFFLHLLTSNDIFQDSGSHHNHLSKLYWFPLFKYMECNIHKPIPRKSVNDFFVIQFHNFLPAERAVWRGAVHLGTSIDVPSSFLSAITEVGLTEFGGC